MSKGQNAFAEKPYNVFLRIEERKEYDEITFRVKNLSE